MLGPELTAVGGGNLDAFFSSGTGHWRECPSCSVAVLSFSVVHNGMLSCAARNGLPN